MTARTARRPPSAAPALGGLLIVGPALAAGVALVLVKWLLVTVALLVVPFAVWWFVDRARRPANPTSPSAAIPAPIPAPIPASRRDAVTAVLPPAAIPLPRRPAPAPSSRPFLAPDRSVAVVADEGHQGTLARHHRDRPVTRVTAELRASTAPGGARHGERAVEVCLDGERVGELPPAASARYRHHLAPAAGRHPACLATIAHSERGYQIEVRLPRS